MTCYCLFYPIEALVLINCHNRGDLMMYKIKNLRRFQSRENCSSCWPPRNIKRRDVIEHYILVLLDNCIEKQHLLLSRGTNRVIFHATTSTANFASRMQIEY